MADLVGAVRLPEGSMRATAGTEVVIDVLVFQRRAEGQATSRPRLDGTSRSSTWTTADDPGRGPAEA